MEWLIAQVLLWGGLLSGLLVLFGLVLYTGQGGFAGHVLELQRLTRPGAAGHPTGVFVSLREVLAGLSARPLDPVAIIALGFCSSRRCWGLPWRCPAFAETETDNTPGSR
jgi:hypothetical protein